MTTWKTDLNFTKTAFMASMEAGRILVKIDNYSEKGLVKRFCTVAPDPYFKTPILAPLLTKGPFTMLTGTKPLGLPSQQISNFVVNMHEAKGWCDRLTTPDANRTLPYLGVSEDRIHQRKRALQEHQEVLREKEERRRKREQQQAKLRAAEANRVACLQSRNHPQPKPETGVSLPVELLFTGPSIFLHARQLFRQKQACDQRQMQLPLNPPRPYLPSQREVHPSPSSQTIFLPSPFNKGPSTFPTIIPLHNIKKETGTYRPPASTSRPPKSYLQKLDDYCVVAEYGNPIRSPSFGDTWDEAPADPIEMVRLVRELEESKQDFLD